MANKIYPFELNPTDILIQNEGGGGVVMNDQSISIVGNMATDNKQLLDSQKDVSTTDIKTHKFSSAIIITNNNSDPLSVKDLSSNNFDSLDEGKTDDPNVVNTKDNSVCGGAAKLNYEFQSAAKNFSLWEEVNSNGGNSNLKSFDTNQYVRTERQYQTLLFDNDVISSLPIDGTDFKNLGWDHYGSGQPTLSDNITNFYDNYWVANIAPNNKLGGIKDKTKPFKNTSTNIVETRSIFDIQTLPSGLRTMCLRTNYNSGDTWINRLLTTVGPDYLNESGLGITINESKNGNGGLAFEDKVQKFYDQYQDIIDAYNSNKTVFISSMVKENYDWYVRLVDQGKDSRFTTQPDLFKTFYKTYLDIAQDIALIYMDCPDEFTITQQQTPASTATPTPSQPITQPPTPSPAVSQTTEEEEGIYDANFLPATEELTFQTNDIIYVTDTDVVKTLDDNPDFYTDGVKIDDITYDNKGEKATDAAVYYGDSTPYINQKTNWACLVTSLVMLFRGSGNNSISENTFIKFATNPPAFNNSNTRTGKYMLSSNNLNMAGLQKDYPSLKRESKNLKTQSDVYERYKTKLKEHQKPLIIRISGTSNRARGHFVVLVGISKTGTLIIHNPGSSKVAFKDTEVVESKMLKNGEPSSGFNCDIIYYK